MGFGRCTSRGFYLGLSGLDWSAHCYGEESRGLGQSVFEACSKASLLGLKYEKVETHADLTQGSGTVGLLAKLAIPRFYALGLLTIHVVAVI